MQRTSTTTEEEDFKTTITREEEDEEESSAATQTHTRTLDDGAVTVVTTTSWVDVTAPSDDSPDASDPDLQNAASKSATLTLFAVSMAVTIGMIMS